MTITTPAMFTFSLGDDAALIPRTPALTAAYHELLAANRERLARWDPGSYPEPLTLESTRERLRCNALDWLAGTRLPVAIAIRHGGARWRLVGGAALSLDGAGRMADIGYWIDSGFEGSGLVTRTVTALLDHAFGDLGLDRVRLATDAANHRSRALAHRLGFSQEEARKVGNPAPGARSDDVLYSLFAEEWNRRRRR